MRRAFLALILAFQCIGMIYNALLLYAMVRGGSWNSKRNHDVFSFSIVVIMCFLCVACSVLLTWLSILGLTMAEAPLICNVAGTVVVFGVGTILTLTVLFAADRFLKIVQFKDVALSKFSLVFVALVTVILIIIGITFSSGNRNFTPNINGVWCFPQFISSDVYTLLPGILCILWLGLAMSLVSYCYVSVWWMVRKVRRAVRLCESNNILLANSIISITTPLGEMQGSVSGTSTNRAAHENNSISISKPVDEMQGSVSGKVRINQKQHQDRLTSTMRPSESAVSHASDDIEHQVFKMCCLMVTSLVVCWTFMFMCIFYKLISQQLAPVWAEEIALFCACLDFEILTPTALIRFNKLYRKYWFEYVIPASMVKNRVVLFIFGKP